MDGQIKVSIITSVYNTRRYLKKCLDSLVKQTLSDIEIIAVNNGSTDGSDEILGIYEEKYPDIFKLITLEKNTGDPSEPWNIGIRKARGEYISIVDSDDWCDITMFEQLYDSAEKYKAEMVICDHFEVYGEHNFVRAKMNAKEGELSVEQLMLYPHLAPWGKIIRKEIYTKNNLSYKSQIHCDTGLNIILYSLLKKVTYVDAPLYYYNKINPNSETNTKKRMRQAEIVGTLDHILEHYNKEWEDEVVFSVVRFIYWFCFTEYIFHQDIFIPFIKEHETEIRRNKYIKANKEGLGVVIDYLDKELVPKRIIYCTFGRKELSEMEQCCVDSWRRYTSGYKFIELNESNCCIDKVSAIKQAYEDGEYEIVSDYFAMRELYDNGGIFLSTNMMMNGPIGELRTHRFTVGFDSLDTIGSDVISAVPKTSIARQLCEHISSLSEFADEDEENEEDIWNADRSEKNTSVISEFFSGYFQSHSWPLSNQNMVLNGDFLVLSSDRLYYEINQNNLFYKAYPETFRVCSKPFMALHGNAIKSFSNYINGLELQCRTLSQELWGIQNSRSWRYTQPIRNMLRIARAFRERLKHLVGAS